jgi:uncharacterized OsmC-like protein
MVTTFKAIAKKTKTGLQVESEARNFKIIMDEPASLGGSNTGMNPVEAVICALGSCQSIVAAAFAESQGFKYESFSVELEGDLDPDGMMGVPGVRKGLQEIRFKMHFKTDEPQDKCDKFADFIESRCPVGDTLTAGVKLVRTAVIKD